MAEPPPDEGEPKHEEVTSPSVVVRELEDRGAGVQPRAGDEDNSEENPDAGNSDLEHPDSVGRLLPVPDSNFTGDNNGNNSSPQPDLPRKRSNLSACSRVSHSSNRRASIVLPEDDQLPSKLCSAEMQSLLEKLNLAGKLDSSVDIGAAIHPVLNSRDASVVLSVLTEGSYGWEGDKFQDATPKGQVALRLRDDLMSVIRSEKLPDVTTSPHGSPLPRIPSLSSPSRKGPADVPDELVTSDTWAAKKACIPGQSRPGAPPSNQFNTQAASLFILSGDITTCTGRFRYKVFKIIDSTAFERAVLAMIMANSVTLALDIPSTRGNAEMQEFLRWSEYVFLGLFTVECALKIIALGFAFHKHSYLSSSWNKMDFLVIATGYISLAPGVENYSVIRLLRVVRPLRVVNRVPQMKSIMNALIQSLPGMRDVFLLLAFFLVIFAIVGVQLFAGRHHQRCYFDESYLADPSVAGTEITARCGVGMCLFENDEEVPCGMGDSGRQCIDTHGTTPMPQCQAHFSVYRDPVLNFDTFYSAALLVFKVISLDDWPADMANVQNAMGWGYWVYFLLITLFGAFFCINLFLAVLSLEYYRAKVQAETEEDAFQKEEDEGAVWELADSADTDSNSTIVASPHKGSSMDAGEALQRMATNSSIPSDNSNSHMSPAGRNSICRSVRCIDPRKRRQSEVSIAVTKEQCAEVKVTAVYRARMAVKAFVLHAYFSHFMLFVTCFNVLVMTLDHHEAPEQLEEFINWANFTCSIIFIWEMLIKWFGLGLVDYFTESYKDVIPAMVGDDRKNVAVVRRRIDGYNTFDCVLVLISIPELILSAGSGSNFSAFRIFRLARMLRLLGKYPTLRQLLLTIVASVVAVAYLFLIMLLFIFICGILGLQLFENAYPPESRANFNSLWESFLTVFIVITGESWATIMKEAMLGTNAAAFLYFVPLFIFGNYMVINLFIAILIDEFMRTKEYEDDDEKDRSVEASSIPGISGPRNSIKSVQDSLQALARVATGEPEDLEAKNRSTSIEVMTKNLMASRDMMRTKVSLDIRTMPARASSTFFGGIGDLNKCLFGEWQRVMQLPPEERADIWDLHGTSLAFFRLERTHPLRLAMAAVVMHPIFNFTVLMVILANVVFLAVDHPKVSPEVRNILDIGDIVFTVLFTVEALMKIIVMGFCEAKDPDGVPKAYLTHLARESEGIGSKQSMGVWNRMDLFVVITAFVGIGVTELKLARSLRTIRLVVHSEGIRVVIMSLFRALSGLANVTVVCLFLWLSFGIIAVQMFKGTFYYCNDIEVDSRLECDGNYTVQEATPTGSILVQHPREWLKLRYNFDHLAVSLLTLFEVAVGEGWATIMWSGIDARGVDLNPRRNANPINALFFCSFVVVGQFFAMNLFVGMLIEVFTSSKAVEEGSVLMTPAQRKWVRANKMLNYVKLTPVPLLPKVRTYRGCITYSGETHAMVVSIRAGSIANWEFGDIREKECVSVLIGAYRSQGERFMRLVGAKAVLEGPITDSDTYSGKATVVGCHEGTFTLQEDPPSALQLIVDFCRACSFRVAIHPYFDNSITVLILTNVCMMCIEHYNQPEVIDKILLIGNSFFVGAFTVEMILKMMAHGTKNYFRDDWNKFDFLLVVCSYVGVTQPRGRGVNALRVLRIGRVFRLIKRAKNLQKLFGTLMHALPSLANVSLLLVVTFFIFGVVGVELFGSVTLLGNTGLTEYTNFKNVPYALITLYQVATTETWTDVMDGCMANEGNSKCKESEGNCGSVAAIPYFVLFMLAGSFALLNLFITIVLDEFNNLTDEDDEEPQLKGWVGLETSESLKTQDKLLLIDDFRQKWRKVDPLATGRIRANSFITIMRVWCVTEKLASDARLTDLWLLRILTRIAIPVDDNLMVRYEDVVQSLLKQLFQISLGDATGIQKFVKARQWAGDEYLMIAHYFAIHKIMSIWNAKRMVRERHRLESRDVPKPAESQERGAQKEDDAPSNVPAVSPPTTPPPNPPISTPSPLLPPLAPSQESLDADPPDPSPNNGSKSSNPLHQQNLQEAP